MSIEAMKQALEALEESQTDSDTMEFWDRKAKAITAIKQALAAPVQEPVATDWERIARVQNAKLMAVCDEAGGFEKLCEVMDKYEATTPPQRKPLTDEEILELAQDHYNPYQRPEISFARAIEAKLKEKNTP